jgi:hypothetical protein
MEGNGIVPNPELENDANAGIAGADNSGEQEQQQQQNEPVSWQEQALAYARENGREVNSFDELLSVQEKKL